MATHTRPRPSSLGEGGGPPSCGAPATVARYTVLLVILATMLAPSTARAQEQVVIGFTVGGVEHVIAYSPTWERHIPRLREAARIAFEQYHQMWGETPPLTYINLNSQLGLGRHDAGVATRRTDIVPIPDSQTGSPGMRDHCYVILRPEGVASDLVEMIVAHELAHCFQFFHTPFAYPGADGDFWWVEGSAQWMAAQAFPSGGYPYLRVDQSDLVNDLGRTILFKQRYEAVYFWEYVARSRGAAGVIQLLRQMPEDPAEYEAYLRTQLQDLSTEFRDFGLAVGRRELAHLPSQDALWGRHVMSVDLSAARSASVEVETPRLFFNLYTLRVSGIGQRQGLEIRAPDPSTTGARVTLADERVEITEAGVARFCGDARAVRLVVSGGSTMGADLAKVPLTFSVIDCSESSSVLPPPCMVGTWKLLSWPDNLGVRFTITAGTQILQISERGEARLQTDYLEVSTKSSAPVQTISMRFRDVLLVFRISEMGRDGSVTTETVDVRPGQYDMVIDGESLGWMDSPPESADRGATSTPPKRIRCRPDGTLGYATVTAQGEAFESVFGRIDHRR